MYIFYIHVYKMYSVTVVKYMFSNSDTNHITPLRKKKKSLKLLQS